MIGVTHLLRVRVRVMRVFYQRVHRGRKELCVCPRVYLLRLGSVLSFGAIDSAHFEPRPILFSHCKSFRLSIQTRRHECLSIAKKNSMLIVFLLLALIFALILILVFYLAFYLSVF